MSHDGTGLSPSCLADEAWRITDLAYITASDALAGFADNNVPTGLQIVGRTFDNAATFQMGPAHSAK